MKAPHIRMARHTRASGSIMPVIILIPSVTLPFLCGFRLLVFPVAGGTFHMYSGF